MIFQHCYSGSFCFPHIKDLDIIHRKKRANPVQVPTQWGAENENILNSLTPTIMQTDPRQVSLPLIQARHSDIIYESHTQNSSSDFSSNFFHEVGANLKQKQQIIEYSLLLRIIPQHKAERKHQYILKHNQNYNPSISINTSPW